MKGGYLPPQVLLHPSMAFSTSGPLHQVRELRAEPRWTWMSSCSGQLTNLKVYIFFNVLFFYEEEKICIILFDYKRLFFYVT